MRNRRRARRGKYQTRKRNNHKLTFTPVIVLLCLSIGCGYAAAKYVVDPVVNYVPHLTAEKAQDNSNTSVNAGEVIEDEAEITEKEKVSGYALQFGCYSSKAAADSVMPTINVDGLQVIEQDEMYKIIGEVYKTKKEAKAALETIPDTVKVFVTPIYE